MSRSVFTRNVCHCFHFTNYYFYCPCSSYPPQIRDASQKQEGSAPSTPKLLFWTKAMGPRGVPALSFCSLTRAEEFVMAKIPNRQVPFCALIPRCPQDFYACFVFPGALPPPCLSHSDPGFSQPLWIPPFPLAPALGRIWEDCAALDPSTGQERAARPCAWPCSRSRNPGGWGGPCWARTRPGAGRCPFWGHFAVRDPLNTANMSPQKCPSGRKLSSSFAPWSKASTRGWRPGGLEAPSSPRPYFTCLRCLRVLAVCLCMQPCQRDPRYPK